MAKRRLSVSLHREPALIADRVTVGKDKLVYVIIADKRLSYPNGNSKIVYIGTTKKGISRVAASAALKVNEALKKYSGIKKLTVRIVTCKPRQKVRTWFALERALLTAFRLRYGKLPKSNLKGEKLNPDVVFTLFARKRMGEIIDDLS